MTRRPCYPSERSTIEMAVCPPVRGYFHDPNQVLHSRLSEPRHEPATKTAVIVCSASKPARGRRRFFSRFLYILRASAMVQRVPMHPQVNPGRIIGGQRTARKENRAMDSLEPRRRSRWCGLGRSSLLVHGPALIPLPPQADRLVPGTAASREEVGFRTPRINRCRRATAACRTPDPHRPKRRRTC